MTVESDAQLLASYVRSLDDFTLIDEIVGDYDHMGATILDAVLQAGTTYDTVVRPRVERILADYPGANTTSRFLDVLLREGAKSVLDWDHNEKPLRVIHLTGFLWRQGIETEEQLREWIEEESNVEKLLSIKGVGPKTVDYLGMLVGRATVAVDRHLIRFLENAGVSVTSYAEAREILNQAADILGIDRRRFDQTIWHRMSGGVSGTDAQVCGKRGKQPGGPAREANQVIE
jgi:endonuclease III